MSQRTATERSEQSGSALLSTRNQDVVLSVLTDLKSPHATRVIPPANRAQQVLSKAPGTLQKLPVVLLVLLKLLLLLRFTRLQARQLSKLLQHLRAECTHVGTGSSSWLMTHAALFASPHARKAAAL